MFQNIISIVQVLSVIMLWMSCHRTTYDYVINQPPLQQLLIPVDCVLIISLSNTTMNYGIWPNFISSAELRLVPAHGGPRETVGYVFSPQDLGFGPLFKNSLILLGRP